MPRPHFADVGSLSITELCIAFMVMRDRNAAADDMAEQLECWFDLPVRTEDVAPSLARMVERAWIAHHPLYPHRLVVTDAGEDVAYRAFTGLLRLVDEGNYGWIPDKMWQLARTRLPVQWCR
jgi:hypothetical protein